MSERGMQQVDGGQRSPQRLGAVRDLAAQVVVVAGAALLYFAVRGITEGNEQIAVRNAETLMRIESRLGLAVEATAQALILDRHAVVTAANWVYIWGHWPVIIVVLGWLYACRRERYRLLLRAMLISGGIGLIMFAAYPVAPPRLMPDDVFVDTVTELSRSYRVLQPPALVNKFAALPSLHVGWNLLVGIVVFGVVRNKIMRGVAMLLPALMAVAVVVTGNHYIIDALVGSVVALAGLGASSRLARRGGNSPTFDEDRIVDDHTGRPQAVEAGGGIHAVDIPNAQTPNHTGVHGIAPSGESVDPNT